MTSLILLLNHCLPLIFAAAAPQALLAQTMTIVDFIPSSTSSASSSTTHNSTSGTTIATTASISTSSSIQLSTSSSSTPASISSTSLPQKQSSTLSVGAKAGIGIGIALLILALITGLAFWLLKRKKNKPTNQNQMSHGPAKTKWDVAGEMPANNHVVEKHAPVTQVHEADSTPPRMHSVGNTGRGYEMG